MRLARSKSCLVLRSQSSSFLTALRQQLSSLSSLLALSLDALASSLFSLRSEFHLRMFKYDWRDHGRQRRRSSWSPLCFISSTRQSRRPCICGGRAAWARSFSSSHQLTRCCCRSTWRLTVSPSLMRSPPSWNSPFSQTSPSPEQYDRKSLFQLVISPKTERVPTPRQTSPSTTLTCLIRKAVRAAGGMGRLLMKLWKALSVVFWMCRQCGVRRSVKWWLCGLKGWWKQRNSSSWANTGYRLHDSERSSL